MKYFSMFSGIGGFELGIQRVFDNEYAHISEKPEQEKRTQGGERPTDKQGLQLHTGDRPTALCNRRKGHTNYGDATTINPKELPDFDLLVGGFPCQAFSVAGKRGGFNDTRGTLFFDIARILAEKRPRHLVLENVKGLLSHDSGKTFQTILGVLSDLGYRVEWQVLNSKDFGVPQNRERIYIVGHLGDGCGGQVFPIRQSNQVNTKQRVIGSTLTGRYPASQREGTYIEKEGQNRPTFRKLTPIECERLQCFPDDWTEYGIGEEPISDTQRYKMCGNAVTVNVVEAAMERLLNEP
jgi:DNA (cytosine-5)-methyltransferase 1